jgi:hypothetical protein
MAQTWCFPVHDKHPAIRHDAHQRCATWARKRCRTVSAARFATGRANARSTRARQPRWRWRTRQGEGRLVRIGPATYRIRLHLTLWRLQPGPPPERSFPSPRLASFVFSRSPIIGTNQLLRLVGSSLSPKPLSEETGPFQINRGAREHSQAFVSSFECGHLGCVRWRRRWRRDQSTSLERPHHGDQQ